jgi:hypothetical protein
LTHSQVSHPRHAQLSAPARALAAAGVYPPPRATAARRQGAGGSRTGHYLEQRLAKESERMKPYDWTDADQELAAFKEKVDTLIYRDLCAAGSVPFQDTIYHYTDVKGALGILDTGRLWFTERVHLNDPVEIRYGIGVAQQLFEAAIGGRAIPENAALRLKGEHDVDLAMYGFWICCFSLNGDDLGQWRNYADNGQGVCLGFSTDRLDINKIAEKVPNTAVRLRFPVNYDETHLRRNMQLYVDTSIDVLEKANLPARDSYYQPNGRALLYERDLFRVLNNGFYANSLLFKHVAYAYEQEYRLLVSGLRTTISASDHHRLRERSGEIVGYLSLPIPGWKEQGVLTHIRLGPAAPDRLADQLRMTLAALGVPALTIDKSPIPYRPTRAVS